MKIIIWLLLTPVMIFFLGVIGAEMNKAYWDYRVEAMCEKDGGTTIYEKIEIYKSDYPNLKLDSNNNLMLSSYINVTSDTPFFYRYKVERLYEGILDLDVIKHEQSIIRGNDKKILNKMVSFSRRGGDFPPGFHPSNYSCRDAEKNIYKYASTITVKGS